MQQGHPIEFFIEGTRSRTGKLIKPRYGVLEMILSAFATGRVERVAIVPISVGYEKVIESKSHRKEVLGAEKTKEGLAELLKTPRVLTSKYGRLYVQFADPIDLSTYLESHDIDRLRPWRERAQRGDGQARTSHHLRHQSRQRRDTFLRS